MELSITKLEESTIVKHYENGTKSVVSINAASYPETQAFLNAYCEEIRSSSVFVIDKYSNYELYIRVDAYAGELMPNSATVLYDAPTGGEEGYTILSNKVKAELDALVLLIP